MSQEKLPLEKLLERYIPVSEFPEKYGVSVSKVMSLISAGKVKKGEFSKPGERRRILHVDYVEVLKCIEEENNVE